MHALLDLQKPATFVAITLGRGAHNFSRRSRWFRVLRHQGLEGVARSTSLRISHGQWVFAGEFLLYRTSANGVAWAAGLAVEFWEASAADGAKDIFAIIQEFRLLTPEAAATSWIFQEVQQFHVTHHSHIVASTAFVRDGNVLRALMPLFAAELFEIPV